MQLAAVPLCWLKRGGMLAGRLGVATRGSSCELLGGSFYPPFLLPSPLCGPSEASLQEAEII